MPIAGILSTLGRNVIGAATGAGANIFENILGQKYGTRAKMEELRNQGLTPQEAVGAASGTGGQPGGTATALKLAELDQARELEKGRQALTKRQQDINAQTSRDVAKIQGQTARDTARINQEVPRGHLGIAQQKAPEEVKKLANEAANSERSFVLFLKAMSMSPQNVVASGVYAKWKARGFDMMNEESWNKTPKKIRREAIAELLAVGSSVYREARGAKRLADDVEKVAAPFEETLPGRLYETGRSIIGDLRKYFAPVERPGSTHYKN